jgi:hypothetical protein
MSKIRFREQWLRGCLYCLAMLAQSGGRVKVSDPVASVRYDDGSVREFTLDRLRLADFDDSVPWRQVRSLHGQAHYSGSYASATMGGFVVYESRLELARLLLADFDPQVRGIYAQPFLLAARVSGLVRRHVPDFLLVSEAEAGAAPAERFPRAGDVWVPAGEQDKQITATHVLAMAAPRPASPRHRRLARCRMPDGSRKFPAHAASPPHEGGRRPELSGSSQLTPARCVAVSPGPTRRRRA